MGASADYVRPGESGLHATSEAEWVDAIRQLADDAALRERLGRAGRRRVEREFDVRVLETRLLDLVAEVIRA
ncbi:unnamed protein product [marine sediment metagenome]|uniref:Spore protein YkvP/CgeB glycosyl transferase-like domain-containing protein n=1 Tax=marine sediment metagenome TaxID=412755 RepID=X0YK08_9ZZZZ